MERTVVMDSSDIILPQHLCIDPLMCKLKGMTDNTVPMTLEELEKKHILETLSISNYNRTKTAKILGISLRTLRNKLKKYKV